MPDHLDSEQQKRYRSYLNVHLKKDELDIPADEQIAILQKKNRKQRWFLVINVAAILFFGYSFFLGITKLSDTLFYILGAVFVINMVMIFYQRKQIGMLIQYLEQKKQ